MASDKYYSQQGITLTELAISIVIISFILGGVLGGYNLVQTAKLRKLTTEMTAFHENIGTFQESYRYLPGDIPIAEDYWTAAATNNGNGNGILDGSNYQENLLLWQHLTLADYIPGSYTGLIKNGTTNLELKTNVPASDPYPNAVFIYIENPPSGYIYGTKGLYLRVAEISSGEPSVGMMSAKEAYSVDMKLDDGNASTGMFYTIRQTSGCTTAASTASSADYDLSNKEKTCILVYWKKKT